VTKDELMAQFQSFLKTVPAESVKSIVGYIADESDSARESAFTKWQQLQNTVAHVDTLAGSARSAALKAWHTQMNEFAELMGKLDNHPVNPPAAAQTKAA